MSIPAFVVAVSLFLVTVAVNLQVPLYRTYAQAAGYGNGLTAVVFATYAAGVLPVLILFGGISDRLGRKPVILLSLVSTMLATLLVIVWPNIHMLFIARLLQGVGVGLSFSTGTAYLAEILGNPTRAADYVGITTSLGLGSGALLTSVALLYNNSLVPVSYWGVLAATLLCTACMMSMPNSRNASRKKLLRLPHFPTGTVRFSLAIAATWSVTGLIVAILPTELARHQLTAWTGSVIFLAVGIGAFFQPWARRLAPERSVKVGAVLIILAYVLLVVGVGLGIISLVLAGSAISGAAGLGFSYIGGLAAVTKAGGKERTRTVSGYFLFAYLGLGLPTILIGFLADTVGVLIALVGYGFVIIAANAWLGFRLRLSR